MQCGGHELVVLGTCISYCKVLLPSLYMKSCGSSVCATLNPPSDGVRITCVVELLHFDSRRRRGVME